MNDTIDVEQDLNRLLKKMLELDGQLQVGCLMTLIEIVNKEGLSAQEYADKLGFPKDSSQGT